MNSDFVVAIITYKRPDFFSQCLSSVLSFLPKDRVFVVNDGSPYSEETYQGVKVIQHETNKGVAITKNTAMKYFVEQTKYTHFFLLEDDIIIKRADTFDTYIRASDRSNILHFNYGPGSPFNRKQDTGIRIDLDTRHLLHQDSEPNPKLIVDYKDVQVALYEHTVAMFSYFHRKALEKVGYFDEKFSQYNCWEHVEHTQRITNAGFTTPFWWFADIANSQDYLTEAPGAIDKSSIAKKKDEWMQNVMKGRELYKSIHGCYPNHTPLTSEENVLQFLKKIK